MPAPIVRRDGKKAKILYIEDNPENRMLVRAILESEGYTVVDAEDGLAGIEAAVREEPALILLDVNLPAIDGYEVVAILKSFPAFANTPVVALTAYAMEGDRQRTLVAGCEGYIQKPIDVDAFPRQVEEFLHGKREQVEEREQSVYLRELNQRLVYRLVNQVEELKRLNQHFVRRATQLADLHRAVQDITSEVGVGPMLEQLLPALAKALGTRSLSVELTDTPIKVTVAGEAIERPRSVLAGTGAPPADDWTEVDWTLPLDGSRSGAGRDDRPSRAPARRQGRRGATAQHRRQPGGHRGRRTRGSTTAPPSGRPSSRAWSRPGICWRPPFASPTCYCASPSSSVTRRAWTWSASGSRRAAPPSIGCTPRPASPSSPMTARTLRARARHRRLGHGAPHPARHRRPAGRSAAQGAASGRRPRGWCHWWRCRCCWRTCRSACWLALSPAARVRPRRSR